MTVKDHKNNTFKTIKELCQHYNLPRHIYKYRMERNWSLKDTLETPLYERPIKYSKNPATDHLGNDYPSCHAMCQHYNLDMYLYKRRIKKGWSKEKALTTPSNYKEPQGQPVTDHKGVTYPSQKKLCDAYGIHPSVFSRKFKKGYPMKDILEPKEKYLYDDGIGHQFKTLEDFAKHYNVTPTQLSKTLKAGKSIQDLVQAPKTDRRQKTYKDHYGNTYQCLSDLLAVYDLPKNVYHYRKRQKWAIKDILTTPVDQTKHKKIFEDHKGNRYVGLQAMLDVYKIARPVYDYRIKNGWSLEKTLTTPVNHKQRQLA